ncbi:hypothetical protein RGQ29_007840 [Quercus rubra]|uniref:CCHC-type domain-containing protein n=1 Tax=Quercus rubra TaxID=3512 RepID=A0AAN7DZA4_QUERU|nr:hypothetical protein RGQ29_007840 [Quercus rubra]
MATRPDPDIDDDFSELYKEYTGPLGSATNNVQDKGKTNKRSQAGSDEEEEQRDPNAVPTDFTSREAKVWEAKSKATERIWKKRKEEEMICKICGESGHFTQGCPSTLGANRKSQDFFERVPAREKHVKALFSEKVIQKIEKDMGCKIKMEEKFIIVSGKDRLILAKGVDAVHKVIKDEGDQRGSSSSHMARSRSPERSPVDARMRRSESQRSYSGPQNASQFQQRFGRQEKVVEDRIRDDLQKFSRGSPQGRDSIGYLYGVHRKLLMVIMELEVVQAIQNLQHILLTQTLEELEMEYKRDAMELGRIRDKEEDEENYRHREAIREMRENYMKQLASLRGTHAKQWEEFLQLDAQRRQQQPRQPMPTSGFGGYKQHGYSDYDGTSANPHYAGANLAMDSRSRYPNPMENYSSRPNENFSDFQRQRREDYGKAYNRY